MTNFTDKQRKFIAAKAMGMKNRDAAIEAGYASGGAAVAASKLMTKAHVRAAIAKSKRSNARGTSVDEEETQPARIMQRPHYEDPMQFLRDIINNEAAALVQRQKAATDLMPYIHARIGEKGKKEKRVDDAHGVTKGKFSPKTQPKLATVTPIRRG